MRKDDARMTRAEQQSIAKSVNGDICATCLSFLNFL